LFSIDLPLSSPLLPNYYCNENIFWALMPIAIRNRAQSDANSIEKPSTDLYRHPEACFATIAHQSFLEIIQRSFPWYYIFQQFRLTRRIALRINTDPEEACYHHGFQTE
jgi:hypothetical protein